MAAVVGAFVVEVELDVAIEIPIQTAAPGGGFAGGGRGDLAGEGRIVERDLLDARDDFEGAPGVFGQAEGTEGGDADEGGGFEAVLFTSEEGGEGNKESLRYGRAGLGVTL
jgi:hypothetical protein